MATALPTVLELIRRLGAIGKPVHFHLHDGHPLIAGLPDHFSFLTQVPVPFTYEHRRSLAPLYGPAGLASIVTTAVKACGASGPPSRWRSTRRKAACPSATPPDCSGTGATPPTRSA